MQEKTKLLTKKNLYMALTALLIVAIIVTTIIAIIVSSKPSSTIELPKNSASASVSKSPSNSKSEPDSRSSSTPDSSLPNVPTDAPICFVCPVLNGSVMTDYTQAGVVYNQTLGMYTGHMGLDITGAENAPVLSAYDGEITAIETTYLQGTTITVDHGFGLVTKYNSLEPAEGLAVGKMLEKGEEIGVISTANKQEYKDGAHLHFEVLENGKNVDPYKYLDIDGK